MNLTPWVSQPKETRLGQTMVESLDYAIYQISMTLGKLFIYYYKIVYIEYVLLS